jgi:hypothetical protein
LFFIAGRILPTLKRRNFAAVMGTLRAVSILLGPNVTPADEAARAARALVDQLLVRLTSGAAQA